MEKLFGKSWKTNILAFLIILVIGLDYFDVIVLTAEKINNTERFIGLIMSLGLFATKDSSASHSKELQDRIKELETKVIGPRPGDRE